MTENCRCELKQQLQINQSNHYTSVVNALSTDVPKTQHDRMDIFNVYMMFRFSLKKKLKALPIHGHSSSSILMSLHKSGTFRSLRGPAKRMVKLNRENVIPQHWLQFYGILNVI